MRGFAGMAIILVVIMIVEFGGLYWYFQRDQANGGGAGGPDPNSLVFEHELGTFTDSNVNDPANPLTVDYTVWATVNTDREGDYVDAFEARKNRIKEVISVVIRDATYEELHEASLTAIKRRIKDAVSRELGAQENYIVDIVIPNFQAASGG